MYIESILQAVKNIQIKSEVHNVYILFYFLLPEILKLPVDKPYQIIINLYNV